jgi:glucokinase
VLVSKQITTEVKLGLDGVIARLTGLVHEVVQSCGMTMDVIQAVGIGTPGIVDPINGISVEAVNMGWTQVPLAEIVSKELGLPVFIDNDVKMYVYGEAVKGAGAEFEHVFGLTIGTGLASAYIQGGDIFGGTSNLAGEFGHIPYDEIDIPCSCGLTGCLEKVVSATGIAQQAYLAIQQGNQGWLARHYAETGVITAKNVSEAYDAGDEAAIAIMNHTGRLLGKALSYVIPLMSPEVIIIGGGAAYAGERLFVPMREELLKRLTSLYHDRFTIRTAQFLDHAGVIGSGLRALALVNK